MKPFNLKLIAPFSLYLIISLYALYISLYNPYYNWDLIGYIASAKSFEESSVEALHKFTYDEIRKSASAEQFRELIEGKYRSAVYTDVSVFKEQLPFYQVRFIYNSLIYSFYKAGIPVVTSVHLLSGISVAIGVIFIFFFLTARTSGLLVWFIPVFAVVFDVFEIAKLSTPDSLAFLSCIIVAYLFVKDSLSLLLVLPLIVGIRSDLLLFTVPIYIILFLRFSELRFRISISVVASFGIYYAIYTYFNHPGWQVNLYHTFVENLLYPVTKPASISLADYYSAFRRVIFGVFNDYRFFLYLFFSGFLFYLINNENRTVQSLSIYILYKMNSLIVIGVISSFYVFFHLLIYPDLWSRFFTPFYLLTTISLFHLIYAKFFRPEKLHWEKEPPDPQIHTRKV